MSQNNENVQGRRKLATIEISSVVRMVGAGMSSSASVLIAIRAI